MSVKRAHNGELKEQNDYDSGVPLIEWQVGSQTGNKTLDSTNPVHKIGSTFSLTLPVRCYSIQQYVWKINENMIL